ncbi:hypothetical protein LTR10_014505 [Elasticomyces elasticus]|uniref:Clavaminate synthase-like protein n=1 Tax=Exophiala sideris TaxID=1016849 RepID=A0ABR0JSH2_9EURO|nr:hypothetical protein LTR10_014505 [Elasticomyces elasticus]KAK5040484.1 hypothetical protein LTS07_000982 [Exophiala sideris]KAK5043090.1 hypothetical protein LTR13_000861 [Exophiala sideris]KAK5068862.1 hypothetical protein LTR69_000983 [Exophiala sideris]KAK5186458.1 hypothetical protein LTR44_001514 [Eurotiomycetes sp. CCFEE 6388]
MKATTVSLNDLAEGSVTFPTLEEAFGESSLGILVVDDLPARYVGLREKLLSYSSYLAQLPSEELDAVTDATCHYELGWSHGKEALKDGQYDTLKGSYYVDCQSFYGSVVSAPALDRGGQATRGAGNNLWPPESAMPGFRATFEELCTLLIEIGVLVAQAIDLYAAGKHIPHYQHGCLERIVRTSRTHKARLLHYFPSNPTSSPSSTKSPSTSDSSDSEDSWCATHLDDGCLTALTSALYIDDSSPLPPLTAAGPDGLAILPTSPDPTAGLYIHSRGSKVVKIDIPPDSIAFQTGEALQMITGGRFKAVPHFVQGPDGANATAIARNTLALFMQPDIDEVIDKVKGMTYGQFVDMIVQRHS